MTKTIVWDKAALETLRSYSTEVRREVGTLLRLLQQGYRLGMPQSKPLRNLDPSAFELRIGDRRGIYRVFYVLAAKVRLRRLIDEIE
ncbi:MAG: type II toxin-antitoxin system RelE/ParE family toxin [Bdellovibrionales bacterium]|nr:type II toxin-antitoxin system RelE/ParE family toxin [Bdellovibrionales bacterium]